MSRNEPSRGGGGFARATVFRRGVVCFAAVVCAIAAVAAQGRPAASEEIRARQRLERRLADLPSAERVLRLREAGWTPGEDGRLRCALYVVARLSEFEIERLERSHGVIVVGNRWIPAVPGRHPHGFHTASVPFSALDALEADPRVTRLEPLEVLAEPLNNLGRAVLRVEEVQSGSVGPPLDGSGVALAVADSGIDPAHPDLPVPVEAFDVTDGTDPATWDTDVSNTVIDHGTHVTGVAVASGVSSTGNVGNGGGHYGGMSPGADLYFYKIGNDTNGSTTFDDMIEAVDRAAVVEADVFTMSYGGFGSEFLDGSSPVCQAIDAAAASGVTVFISAGNSGNRPHHASAKATSGGSSAEIEYRIVNSGTSELNGIDRLRLIWRDDDPTDANLALDATNLVEGESLVQETYGSSVRGTETKRYSLSYRVPPGETRSILLRVENPVPSGPSPEVHLYRLSGRGGFAQPDPFYTVGHPALCDGAVAVGAWTHRERWINDVGEDWTCCGLMQDSLAPFSSRGPRVDGALKPDLLAPGASTISTRDGTFSTLPARIIDNDGVVLDGSGPSDYYALEGTSMASPALAGAAALLFQVDPGLAPSGVHNALAASTGEVPDDAMGHGLPDLVAALESLPAPGTDLDGDWHPGVGEQSRDCDDGDAAIWATPSEVPLLVSRDRVTLTWARPAEPGADRPAFDVLRATDASDFAAASCVESSDAGDRTAYDAAVPAPGEAFFYLVRAVNGCPAGAGPVGLESGGRPRSAPGCGP